MGFRIFAVVAGLSFALPASVWSQDLGSAKNGQMLAETVCAECHAVGKSSIRSPNGLAPTFSSIANTPGMTPMAVRVWLRSAHREMPNIMLKTEEVDDVIAYLQTLKNS